MTDIRLDEADASLAALIEAAERGETTTILRDGRPVATVAPAPEPATAPEPEPERAAKPKPKRSFAELLLAMPEGLEDMERMEGSLREIDW